MRCARQSLLVAFVVASAVQSCINLLPMATGQSLAQGSERVGHRLVKRSQEGHGVALGLNDTTSYLLDPSVMKTIMQIPLGTLDIVRKLTVPLVDMSLAIPVTVLENFADLGNLSQTSFPGHLMFFNGSQPAHGLNSSLWKHLNFSMPSMPFNVTNMTHSVFNETDVHHLGNHTAFGGFFTPVTSLLNSLNLNGSFPPQLGTTELRRHFNNLRKLLIPGGSLEPEAIQTPPHS